MNQSTGAETLATMLAGYGVTHLFMVPAVLRRALAELERRTDIKRIQTHGEKSAAYMADGYARACGRPGICMAQVVGALNLAAGLRDAYLAHSPVIAFTGGRDPQTKFRKVYQEVDDVPAFAQVTKFNATIDAVERIPDMLRQAFRVAVSGCPGPVHLQFRGNEGQIDADEAPMEAHCEPLFARVPAFRPEPDTSVLERVVTLLRRAARPPMSRFSSTVSEANRRRPSGTSAMPRPTISKAGNAPISRPSNCTADAGRGNRPATALRNVVLPAPLAPITATVSPAASEKVMPWSAWKSP